MSKRYFFVTSAHLSLFHVKIEKVFRWEPTIANYNCLESHVTKLGREPLKHKMSWYKIKCGIFSEGYSHLYHYVTITGKRSV